MLTSLIMRSLTDLFRSRGFAQKQHQPAPWGAGWCAGPLGLPAGDGQQGRRGDHADADDPERAVHPGAQGRDQGRQAQAGGQADQAQSGAGQRLQARRGPDRFVGRKWNKVPSRNPSPSPIPQEIA